MATMLITRLSDKIDDSLNPIVVKELRQAVQSKTVAAVLLLFLAIQLIILGIIFIATELNPEHRSQDLYAGRTIFLWIQGIMLGTCMLLVPIYTWARLTAERSDTNVDLLFITSLKPRSIVGGKFFAALVLMLLIQSACAPFMTFTYLFRGIDIPTILLVLGMDFLAVLGSTQLALFLAVIPANRFFKGLLGAMGFIALLYIYITTMAGSVYLVEEGWGVALDSWDFWGIAGAVFVSVLLMIGLVFSWSVAILSPPTANRAFIVRLFMLFAWIVTGAVFGTWSYLIHDNIPLRVWTVTLVLFFCLELVIAVNEREQWAARVARTIPRFWLFRLPAFLFYSGAAGGVLFSVLMIAASLTIAYLADQSTPKDYAELLTVMTLIGLYTYCYAMTAVFLRSTFLASWIPALYTWLVGVVLFLVGCGIPFVIAFLFHLTWRDFGEDAFWLFSVPFVALDDRENHAVYLFLLTVWAVLITLLCIPWNVRQLARFRPPEERVTG